MKMNWFEKLGVNSPLHKLELRSAARQMHQLGGAVENGLVLEIGCGKGLGIDLIFEMFQPSQVEAFEFDPDQLAGAKKRLARKYPGKLHLFEASATNIPCPDHRFDAVFDFGVLHHIPDNQLALQETARVLKPGGRFFFQEILSSLTMNPVVRFVTRHPDEAQFTREEFLQKLAGVGLTVNPNYCVIGSAIMVGVAQQNLA